ncbi:CrcB family protein [Staphylococcus saprophyticus]|uniref:hypothetical protein n=1 Tax=Staphylococcus saprophyticus TaxID=29385 RepID=UPI00164307E5|nr:hypothetical protein [Staphylococcus saprophyticus]
MEYLFIFVGGGVGGLVRYVVSFINRCFEMGIGRFIGNLWGGFLMGFVGSVGME